MGVGGNATPRPLYSRERPGTHCTGGWVGHRAGLDRCGKSCPTGIRSPGRPALPSICGQRGPQNTFMKRIHFPKDIYRRKKLCTNDILTTTLTCTIMCSWKMWQFSSLPISFYCAAEIFWNRRKHCFLLRFPPFQATGWWRISYFVLIIRKSHNGICNVEAE